MRTRNVSIVFHVPKKRNCLKCLSQALKEKIITKLGNMEGNRLLYLLFPDLIFCETFKYFLKYLRFPETFKRKAVYT